MEDYMEQYKHGYGTEEYIVALKLTEFYKKLDNTEKLTKTKTMI